MKFAVTFGHVSLTLMLTLSRVQMCDFSDSESSCEAGVPAVGVACDSTALALVPYDEKTLAIPDFYRDERRFRFGEFAVAVGQNWRDVGVAAVVWDSVCPSK